MTDYTIKVEIRPGAYEKTGWTVVEKCVDVQIDLNTVQEDVESRPVQASMETGFSRYWACIKSKSIEQGKLATVVHEQQADAIYKACQKADRGHEVPPLPGNQIHSLPTPRIPRGRRPDSKYKAPEELEQMDRAASMQTSLREEEEGEEQEEQTPENSMETDNGTAQSSMNRPFQSSIVLGDQTLRSSMKQVDHSLRSSMRLGETTENSGKQVSFAPTNSLV